jgi:hypothetical protein
MCKSAGELKKDIIIRLKKVEANKDNLMRVVFLALLLLMFSISIKAQVTSKGEIVITFVTAKCIDTTYTLPVFQTRVYPPSLQNTYVKDKLVYEVLITVRIGGDNFVFNRPLALTCYLPKNEKQTLIVNQERDELMSDMSYQYSMILTTKQKGWVKVVVGEWDDSELEINNYGGIKYISGSVYIE